MIDVHAYTVLQEVMGCAGHYGSEIGVGPEGRPRIRVGNYGLDGVDFGLTFDDDRIDVPQIPHHPEYDGDGMLLRLDASAGRAG